MPARDPSSYNSYPALGGLFGHLQSALVSLVFLACLAPPAFAADPYNFSFLNGSDLTSGVVNSKPFSSNGVSVTVTAYSTPYNVPTGGLSRSYVGDYSLGLGVSAKPSDDSHTVDNSGSIDLLVFNFSIPVKVSSISLSQFGDTDFVSWAGGNNLSAGYDFTGKQISQLTSLLGASYGLNSGSNADRTATISNPVFGKYFILAANPTDTDDKFKVAKITAVPAPIAGAGLPALLALLGLRRLRRKTGRESRG